MRFVSFAICTLSILLTGGLTAQASENPSSEGSIQEPVTHDGGVTNPTVTSRGIDPITLSKIPQEQQFVQTAAIDSRKESRLEPSAFDQKDEALTQGQVEELAEIPKSETLNRDNIAAELSTPDVKQSPSEQSLNQKSSLSSAQNSKTNDGATLSGAEALRRNELVAQSSTNNASQLIADAQPKAGATCIAQRLDNSESASGSASYQLAQGSTTAGRCPRPQPIPQLVLPEPVEEFGASPALSIYIPVGYGADRNTLFLNGSYQASVREDEGSVGAGGIGIGLGNADKALGVELSYAIEHNDEEFGNGGFNAKVHRRLGQDMSGALGWNGFLNIGSNDFEQSKYGVITKVFRTQESLNSAFSRVSVTAGVGDGQFRSNGAVDAEDNNINAFGNIAIRVVRPVSFIAEWTGQDLALGLSIAPFKKFPFVITPAVRDLAGAGDNPRFVIGAGTALRF
jgi:hypothetical protein